MSKLKNKTAIVTGASSGIGQAIAEHLANEGANVVIAARREDKLKQIADHINQQDKGSALAVVTDITNQTDVENLVKQATEAFGDIDILVNNAGVVGNGRITDGKLNAWDSMIDVNIKGVLYGINACLPRMRERGTGHIVNTASVSGFEVTKTSAVYSATKFAVRAISMGLEKELARTGVRVTNISPGMVETERTEDRLPEDRKSLETANIANAVIYAVTQPDHVNVNEITVRPV